MSDAAQPHPVVELAPVSWADLDEFDERFDTLDTNGLHQWFGFSPSNDLRAAWSERRLLNGDHNMLTVLADSRVVGRVEWFQRSWGRPTTSACWEIAIGIFADQRAKGIGTEAQRQLLDYLFDHTRVERVQMTTDPENHAQIRAAEKVGFVLEGRARRAQWRTGSWHDQLLYSALRHEYRLSPTDGQVER